MALFKLKEYVPRIFKFKKKIELKKNIFKKLLSKKKIKKY